MQKFNDQLETILEHLFQAYGEFSADLWQDLIEGIGDPKRVKHVKRVEKNRPAVHDQLLRLAYSLRYPKEYSGISLNKIYEALKLPIPPASTFNNHSNQSLDFGWSDKYAQQPEYLNSDNILDPILETLRQNASKWARDEYQAPCTTIIGPTMSGKTRLIMELAKKCRSYISVSNRRAPPASHPDQNLLTTSSLKSATKTCSYITRPF
ncbi:hypothetical protein PGT21_007129 [Puccinia graminis f. sp. tritici]|uniref:Uncharacterized protein n=1 Tax=Puccinia graminis f. sp. tritici TaxID=56615 RepID=A0A5B0PJX0_PUCGR|nr:hypothetical protein PGT21_007129 [Puccinia graminis f. sp. tritici]